MPIRGRCAHADQVDPPARAALRCVQRNPERRATTDVALHLPLGVSWLCPQANLVVASQPAELQGDVAKLEWLPLQLAGVDLVGEFDDQRSTARIEHRPCRSKKRFKRVADVDCTKAWAVRPIAISPLSSSDQTMPGVGDMRWVPHDSIETPCVEQLAKPVPIADHIRLRFDPSIQTRQSIALNQAGRPDATMAPRRVEHPITNGVERQELRQDGRVGARQLRTANAPL